MYFWVRGVICIALIFFMSSIIKNTDSPPVVLFFSVLGIIYLYYAYRVFKLKKSVEDQTDFNNEVNGDKSLSTDIKPKLKRRRLVHRITWGLILSIVLFFLIYFPGRQTPIAFILATGIGVSGLQERVDKMEDKAIKSEDFIEEDKEFLSNLYTCFAKGGGLTMVLRQSSDMMHRYLSDQEKISGHLLVSLSIAIL